MKAKRAYLTPKQTVDMWAEQRGQCGCGCGQPLSYSEGVIGEHVYWMVALGNDGKPDALWRKPCADKKTNGVCGDKWRIAKVKRIAAKKTQADKRAKNGPKLKGNGKPIRSRGFEKTRTRKMNGEVVCRDR